MTCHGDAASLIDCTQPVVLLSC